MHQLPENPKERFKLWRDIGERLAAGETVSEAEQRFHRGFANTADCRAFLALENELGLRPASESSTNTGLKRS